MKDIINDFCLWVATYDKTKKQKPKGQFVKGLTYALLTPHWKNIKILLDEGFTRSLIHQYFLSLGKGTQCTYDAFNNFCKEKLEDEKRASYDETDKIEIASPPATDTTTNRPKKVTAEDIRKVREAYEDKNGKEAEQGQSSNSSTDTQTEEKTEEPAKPIFVSPSLPINNWHFDPIKEKQEWLKKKQENREKRAKREAEEKAKKEAEAKAKKKAEEERQKNQ